MKRPYRDCLEKGFIKREEFCQNLECRECKEFRDKFEKTFNKAPKHGDGLVQKTLNKQGKALVSCRILISDLTAIKDDESKRRVEIAKNNTTTPIWEDIDEKMIKKMEIATELRKIASTPPKKTKGNKFHTIALEEIKRQADIYQKLITQEREERKELADIYSVTKEKIDNNPFPTKEVQTRINELELQEQGDKIAERLAKRSFWDYLRDIIFKW